MRLYFFKLIRYFYVMDFGRLEYEEMDMVEFKLPPIHSTLTPPSHTKIRLGLPMWGEDKFRGTVYPKDAKKPDYMAHYAAQFDAIELNTTFYNLPPMDRVKGWIYAATTVNPDFKFCPKIPESISHKGKLDAHFDELPYLFNVLDAFGPNLGMSFLQLHESFALSRFEEFLGFIELWPRKYKLGIELRHTSWFKPGPIQERLFEIMRAREISLVITDTPGNQVVCHQHFTAPHLMVRFVLTSNHPKDHERRENWARRLLELKDQGLEEIYFFGHERDDTLYMECLPALASELSSQYELRLPIDYSTGALDQQLSLF